MGANQAVPVVAQQQLYPCHIDLDKRGAAALAGFQQDDTDRLTLHAHGFEGGKQDALRAVEVEFDVAATVFVFDGNAFRTPEFKVVAHAQFVELQRTEAFPKACIA